MSANPHGIRLSREERNRQVMALRAQGLTIQQTADRLGVSRTTVTSVVHDPTGSKARARKEKYTGRCVDCGGRTAYSTRAGKACERCMACELERRRDMDFRRERSAQQVGQYQWSDDAIFAAIRSVPSSDGRVTNTMYDRERDRRGRHTMPSIPLMVIRFGSWRKAVEAAGLRVSERGENRPVRYATRISDDGLLAAVVDCAVDLGGWPTANEYDQWAADDRGPSGILIRVRLGNWIGVLDRAMRFDGAEDVGS